MNYNSNKLQSKDKIGIMWSILEKCTKMEAIFLFYENFDALSKKIGKSKSEVARDIGLDPKSCTGWKNGAIPRNSTLRKLADYFDVTVEELMGDKAESTRPIDSNTDFGYEWADVEKAYKGATPEARAAAKAAALAVLESGKK